MLRPALLSLSLSLLAPTNGPACACQAEALHFDCNQNGIEDSVDIALGSSVDSNRNGIPDECEEDLSPQRFSGLAPWR
jgi:hypothetical protein